MNALYVIGGVACSGLGVYLIIRQVRTFIKDEQDRYGFDIQGLGVGIMLIMLGAYLIFKYLQTAADTLK